MFTSTFLINRQDHKINMITARSEMMFQIYWDALNSKQPSNNDDLYFIFKVVSQMFPAFTKFIFA